MESEESKKELAIREKIQKKLDYVYNITDQAMFHIIEKFNNLSSDIYDDLEVEEKELFQKRFEWVTAYLRHFRLGDDCLTITKEVEIYVGDDEEQEQRLRKERDRIRRWKWREERGKHKN